MSTVTHTRSPQDRADLFKRARGWGIVGEVLYFHALPLRLHFDARYCPHCHSETCIHMRVVRWCRQYHAAYLAEQARLASAAKNANAERYAKSQTTRQKRAAA